MAPLDRQVQLQTIKSFFFWAAIWNLCAGGAMLLLPEFQFQFFFGSTLPEGAYHTRLFYRVFAISVVIFGIGYYLVSRDPVNNRGIVMLGTVGKIAVFVLFGLAFMEDGASLYGLLAATGDLLWAIGFICFLARRPGSTCA